MHGWLLVEWQHRRGRAGASVYKIRPFAAAFAARAICADCAVHLGASGYCPHKCAREVAAALGGVGPRRRRLSGGGCDIGTSGICAERVGSRWAGAVHARERTYEIALAGGAYSARGGRFGGWSREIAWKCAFLGVLQSCCNPVSRRRACGREHVPSLGANGVVHGVRCAIPCAHPCQKWRKFDLLGSPRNLVCICALVCGSDRRSGTVVRGALERRRPCLVAVGGCLLGAVLCDGVRGGRRPGALGGLIHSVCMPSSVRISSDRLAVWQTHSGCLNVLFAREAESARCEERMLAWYTRAFEVTYCDIGWAMH